MADKVLQSVTFPGLSNVYHTPTGDPANLTTDAKTNLVAAINEVDADVSALNTELSNKQSTSNLVTSLSSSSTDVQYPSAKCVYDLVGDVETLLAVI